MYNIYNRYLYQKKEQLPCPTVDKVYFNQKNIGSFSKIMRTHIYRIRYFIFILENFFLLFVVLHSSDKCIVKSTIVAVYYYTYINLLNYYLFKLMYLVYINIRMPIIRV